jgi:hypothetical protein
VASDILKNSGTKSRTWESSWWPAWRQDGGRQQLTARRSVGRHTVILALTCLDKGKLKLKAKVLKKVSKKLFPKIWWKVFFFKEGKTKVVKNLFIIMF